MQSVELSRSLGVREGRFASGRSAQRAFATAPRRRRQVGRAINGRELAGPGRGRGEAREAGSGVQVEGGAARGPGGSGLRSERGRASTRSERQSRSRPDGWLFLPTSGVPSLACQTAAIRACLGCLPAFLWMMRLAGTLLRSSRNSSFATDSCFPLAIEHVR